MNRVEAPPSIWTLGIAWTMFVISAAEYYPDSSEILQSVRTIWWNTRNRVLNQQINSLPRIWERCRPSNLVNYETKVKHEGKA
jgi:hypothetical protein